MSLSGLFLKFWDDGNLQFPFTRKLITEQGLTGAIMIVFFSHTKPPVCSKEQVLLLVGGEDNGSCTVPYNYHRTISKIKNRSTPKDTPMVRVGRLELPASCSQIGKERFFELFPLNFCSFRSILIAFCHSLNMLFPYAPHRTVAEAVVKNLAK